MFGITDLSLFIITGLLLNITPGADMLYILSNTFQKGFKTGFAATLGISTGCLFHVFLAVVGLSALLQTSILAFTIVKYVGVVYLVYLGITMFLKTKTVKEDTTLLTNESLKKVFLNGVLINILNPKIALFFITFLPQFIDVNSQNQSIGLLVLGLVFIFFGTLSNIVIAYLSLKISDRFSYTGLFTSILKKIVGTMFITFGIKLALEP
ncbi:hypothetical protein A9Q76_08820 [Arcobacter sp. 31_11_sub10_T18]|nr:hypothetical protein A9Q76_08820 [Arcobacter sp. 31_11_sub10_T18]